LETSLAKSEKDLASAQQKVEEYQTASAKQQERLIALEIKLAIAEEKSKNLDNSLNQINESFKIYEKETKGKIRKLTFEKDLAILVAICFAAKG
jgi:predicted  nucleic acid-binding Zn-ribbon protein